MSTKINTIQDTVFSEFNIKIDETINSCNIDITESKKNCEEGIVPVAKEQFESFIRDIRKKVILKFKYVKIWLGTYVRSTITQEIKTSGIYKLHEAKKAITAITAEKQKLLEEQQNIFKNDYPLTDFEKYSLYGHPEFEQSKNLKFRNKETQDNSVPKREISPKIELTYQKYKSNKKRSLIMGLIISAICAAIDFSIIYTLFLSANYSANLALIIAIISAATLDAPPYVLGYIWTKNDDDKSLLELRDIVNTPEAKRKIKGNKILLVTMLVVIIFAFIAYLIVRVLSFLGGGDFNIAFHNILEKDWGNVKNIVFNGADFISTIVPFATSVVALAVGKMLYTFKTDYIKESIIIINKEIDEKIKKCNDKIIDYEKQISDLEDNLASLKIEIWTFYCGKEPFPTDDQTFRMNISIAFQKLNLSLCEQTYSNCCKIIRNQAMTMLKTVNKTLTEYASDQQSIMEMSLSDDEKKYLDEFWVIENNVPQHNSIPSDLNLIINTVNNLIDNMK